MAQSPVIHALHGKHARIKGFIRHHESTLDQLRADLDHIEAAIRLFKDDWQEGDAIAPRKPSRWLKRGQGIQTALAVLRDASEPMTSREIALAVSERLGRPPPPESELRSIASGFNRNLAGRIGRGVVMVEGKPKRWAISRKGRAENPQGAWRNGDSV